MTFRKVILGLEKKKEKKISKLSLNIEEKYENLSELALDFFFMGFYNIKRKNITIYDDSTEYSRIMGKFWIDHISFLPIVNI